MKTTIIVGTFIFLSTFCFGAIVRDTAIVFFETDQYVLSEYAKSSLMKLAAVAPSAADVKIIIHGHTDSRGSFGYNEELSKLRSLSVKAFFEGLGINEQNILMDYSGELLPLKPNVNVENMQENRRVEVCLTWYDFDDLSELEHEFLSGKAETFELNPREETLIVGRSGTRIHIAANSFLDSNGNVVTEPVNLMLTEAISMEAFIMNGLATMSNDHLLESGGMINLRVKTASGERLSLDPSKAMLVSIPTEQVLPEMQLFLSDSGRNWTETGTKINDSLGYKMPPYPKYEILEFKAPAFKIDYTHRPKKPYAPGYLKEPNEPRRESYVPKEKWYSQITEKEKLDHFEKSYQEAYADYLIRLEEYENRRDSYKADSIEYQNALVSYQQQLTDWQKQVDEDRLNFHNSEAYLSEIKAHDSLTNEANLGYQERVVAWNQLKKERQARAFQKMEKLGIGSQSLLDQYAFSVNQLSWINVDRFYKEDMSETRQVAIRDTDNSPERVFIVFKEMKSVLPMAKTEMMYLQNRIPKNAPAEIFAYKVINGRAHMFNTTLGEENLFEFDFQPCSFTDIKEKLVSYNSSNS